MGASFRSSAFSVAVALLASCLPSSAISPFQPYNTAGDNLIHITTADLEGNHSKDHVVAMSTEGKVIAYPPPGRIPDPAKDARLWEFSGGPSMAIMIEAAETHPDSPGEEILLPGTDGHLRILSATGRLLAHWTVSPGALYCATAAKNSQGEIRILTGGVDGSLYVFDNSGSQLAAIQPSSRPSLLARIVTGNFDGQGGDEAMLFFSVSRLNNKLDLFDLDALDGSRPAYWKPKRAISDSMTKSGWTNRQLPFAYDMDGDGDQEVVAHWGVLHPETGRSGKSLRDLCEPGEFLALENYNRKNHPMTKTGKYLCQLGVPGKFGQGNAIATVYGDDLYLLSHDAQNKELKVDGYSHTPPAYHFSDAARLENGNDAPDQLVLAGPITGDDHFYVVDLAHAGWEKSARSIGGRGQLGKISETYQSMREAIDHFAGTPASPSASLHFFRTAMGGWMEPKGDMTQEQIDAYADKVAANMQKWYDIIGGKENYQPRRLRLVCTGVIREAGVSAPIEDHLAICQTFARRGIHFNMHWDRWMCRESEKFPPSMLADLFEASVHDGVCHLHIMAGEFNVEWFVTENFQPYFDALQKRAAKLGIEPPPYLFSVKGPQWHKMSPEAWSSVFPKYSNLIVPSVENSNQREPALSLSERVGMWLGGSVECWASKTIGDNLTPNRVMEWGGMRHAHIVFRHMLSCMALGARYTSIVSVTSAENPLYERGHTSDAAERWTQTYRDGVFSFLKVVEKGIYPAAPQPAQLLGLSPVALAVDNPNHQRLQRRKSFADYRAPGKSRYALDQLHSSDAYCDVFPNDLTTFLFNSRRRWDNLFPTSPAGFVATLPYTVRSSAEKLSWCERAFQTNLDTWSEFNDLATAKATITDQLHASRETQPFSAGADCFWQVTRDPADANRLYMLLMDPAVLTPRGARATVRIGPVDGAWQVTDQLDPQQGIIGQLSRQNPNLELVVPDGGVRLLLLSKG
jgi:hypothetical protein